MAWSYSGNPGSSNRDSVRFLIGDTDINDPQLSDEEIDYLLVQYPNVYRAAAYAAEAIAAKYARRPGSKSVGDLNISWANLAKNYTDLATRLKTQAMGRSSMPYAGGISQSDKKIDQTNPDNVPPTFYRGQFDLPGSTLNNVDPAQSSIQNL